MNEGRTVFAQYLDFLPKYEFDKCVARYRGNPSWLPPMNSSSCWRSPN